MTHPYSACGTTSCLRSVSKRGVVLYLKDLSTHPASLFPFAAVVVIWMLNVRSSWKTIPRSFTDGLFLMIEPFGVVYCGFLAAIEIDKHSNFFSLKNILFSVAQL